MYAVRLPALHNMEYRILFTGQLDLPHLQREILLEEYEKNPFLKLQDEFRSYYLVDQHIRQAAGFKFLESREIRVEPEDEESFTFQYISIIDTIRLITEDPDFIPEKSSEDGILRGIKDGSVYANNKYFQVNGAKLIYLLTAVHC